MENIDLLKEIGVELDRFRTKLGFAIREQDSVNPISQRYYASCKRAAMDLKNELTKLTQDSKYKYNIRNNKK